MCLISTRQIHFRNHCRKAQCHRAAGDERNLSKESSLAIWRPGIPIDIGYCEVIGMRGWLHLYRNRILLADPRQLRNVEVVFTPSAYRLSRISDLLAVNPDVGSIV